MKPFMMERLYTPTITEEDSRLLTLFNNETITSAFDLVKVNGEEMYRLPRYYKNDVEYADYTTEGEDIDISLKPKYKPLDEFQERAIQSIVENTNGLVSARVGFGKTYVAIDAVTRIKKKTLIVVHLASKKGLMDQWINNIVEYTNLEKDDIGVIRANKHDFDKPVCITTVQTLCSRIRKHDTKFLKKMYLANFGLTYYDECHVTIGAPEFSSSTKAVYSTKLFGLSATPFRSDGLSKLLNWHMGDIVYEDGIWFVLPIYVGLIDIPMDLGKSRKYIEYGNKNGIQARYANFLMKNEAYLEKLVSMIDMCLENGRNPLVLSSRIDMLYKIQERSKHPDMISIVHSDVKDKDYTKQCICATQGMFKMAMDIPRLDTLIFATPLTAKSGLIQAIGRCARRCADKPNKAVMVIDIVNSCYDVMQSMRNTRMRYYDEICEHAPKGLSLVNMHEASDVEKLCEAIKRKHG